SESRSSTGAPSACGCTSAPRANSASPPTALPSSPHGGRPSTSPTEERAALTIAEGVTAIVTGLSDDESAAVAAVLDERRIAAVSWVAVALNALSRVAIASRYRVGA